MSTSQGKVLHIYKSRMNLLKHMQYIGFDTSDYDNFTVKEVDIMTTTNMLDMRFEKDDRKVLIHYILTGKKITKKNVTDAAKYYYTGPLSELKTGRDTLVLVTEDEPSESIIQEIYDLYDMKSENERIHLVVHTLAHLQFNIHDIDIVPPVTILTKEEDEAFRKQYNVMDNSQLPFIARIDPQAKAILLRPGQIVKFKRTSPSAGIYYYYRICV